MLLKKRNGEVIGKINYIDLQMSISGSTLDNIKFHVYKNLDRKECSFWEEIIDLKIIDVVGYGQFEIKLNKTTNQDIFKEVIGQSLETELTQIPLYDLHINDDDYFNYGTQHESNLDSYGNIKLIKLYNPSDPHHSLLHLLLMDKACHWSLGVVPQYITVTNNGNQTQELATSFQRTFTIDNQNIYDFLVNDLANEANLVYVFDTYNRRINIYDRYSVGEDTNVFINTRNLANNITIEDNSESVKNCFRVVGGDDVITNYLSAINLTGNYIWRFSNLQYDDMPEGLVNAIKSYQTLKNTISDEYYGGYDVFNQLILEEKPTNTILTFDGNVNSYSNLPSPNNLIGHYYHINNENKYYVSNGSSWIICGAFTRLCSAYDLLSYLEHSMMPSVLLRTTNAQEQSGRIEREFVNTQVAVSNLSIHSSTSFTGITNSVVAYCKVIIDNRYTVESVDDITSNYPRYNGNVWTGKIHVYRTADKNDTRTFIVSVRINDDELNYAKQKILKAIAKNEMAEVDQDVLAYTTSADYGKLVTYFQKYSLNRLKSFYDGYESCLSILMSFQSSAKDTSAFNTIYTTYRLRRDAVYEVYKIREREVENQKQLIDQIELEKNAIQSQVDFKTYLDNINPSYWKLFNSYRREDTYQNSNYVSDGLTDGQILAKCKELLDYANYQLNMACQLQRTCSISLSNLLIMDEFKPFWDKFQIYNYIRIANDNEILKLRLMQVDIDFDQIEQLKITFSENISGNGNIVNDIGDIIKQAGSMASSYNSIKQQSSQGNKAYNEVGKWIAEGLNAAKTTISNSDNNEVTYGSYGINLKDMTEEGNYGDYQTRLIGQGVYFTQDAWKTVSLALGTIYIDGKRTSGLIADNIIGRLLAGESLYITNEKGSFLLTGDTAKFTDITIDYQDKNGNRVKIGGASDRIFSISHNGNEVLYFNNVSNKMVMTGTLQGCDGDFSGTLNACHMSASTINGSTITGNTISSNSLIGNTITGGSIKIGNNFSVDISGNMNATNANFTGTIHAGTAIYSPSINGGSITGTSINVNNRFKVDSNGNMSATNGSFTGTINAGTSINSPSINGGSINGTSINIANRFTVDSSGNMVASSGTFTGTVYANAGYFKGDLTGCCGIFSDKVIGADVQAKTFSLWNNNSGQYETVITAKNKTSWVYSNVGYNAPIVYGVCANILGTEIFRGAGGACIDTNSIYVDNIYVPFQRGTSNGTTNSRVYYMNGSVDNDGVPSAGWVKGFTRVKNISIGNNDYRYSSGSYTSGTAILRFGANGKADDHYMSVDVPSVEYVQNYIQGYVDAHADTSSDIRLKNNIEDLEDISNLYMKLRPVSYKYKTGLYSYKPNNIEFGLEADRVADLFPCEKYNIAWKSKKILDEERFYCSDYAYRVDYKSIGIMTVQMVQNHQKRIEKFEHEEMDFKHIILSLQGENAILKQRLQRLEELLNVTN